MRGGGFLLPGAGAGKGPDALHIVRRRYCGSPRTGQAAQGAAGNSQFSMACMLSSQGAMMPRYTRPMGAVRTPRKQWRAAVRSISSQAVRAMAARSGSA